MTASNEETRAGSPNVILLSIDCMRRDRLSAYGHERRTTPFLDSMLERSLHATSAHSVSSWTCPSVVSLLSGLYPHHHGGGFVPGEPKNLSKHNLPTKAAEGIPMLPELFRARGYATAAVGAVWNAHLPVPARFDAMAMIEKPAPKLVARSLKWIRAQRGRPFFLWLHLGDAHEPLEVPRSLADVFGPVPKLKNVRTWDFQRSGDDVTGPAFAAYAEARARLYDAAIRAVDASVEDLWKALNAEGLADRTVWAVTADHGEEFWEHRDEEIAHFKDPRDIYGVGHGHTLFQVVTLVPLVLFGAGIPPGVIDENVSLVDVPATLLQAAGIEAPPMDGVSLLDGVPSDRAILSEGIAYGFEKRSVVQGDLKLFSAPRDGYERVHRLGADRRESGALDDPAVADRLRRLLPGGEHAMGEQVEATEEIEEHLRHLGYID